LALKREVEKNFYLYGAGDDQLSCPVTKGTLEASGFRL
jgi:hypothetical protein